MKKLSCTIAAVALSAAFATPASAAHCSGTYSDHVRATNGPAAHNEGDHRGYSSCNENSRNYTP